MFHIGGLLSLPFRIQMSIDIGKYLAWAITGLTSLFKNIILWPFKEAEYYKNLNIWKLIPNEALALSNSFNENLTDDQILSTIKNTCHFTCYPAALNINQIYLSLCSIG
jgi:hypothetical protein